MSAPLSIKWDDDADESKVPIDIPIKPQNGLLKVIATLVIVGGILVFSIGILGFMSQEVPPDFYEDQANQMNAAGQNVTVEEVQQFFEATEKWWVHVVEEEGKNSGPGNPQKWATYI